MKELTLELIEKQIFSQQKKPKKPYESKSKIIEDILELEKELGLQDEILRELELEELEGVKEEFIEEQKKWIEYQYLEDRVEVLMEYQQYILKEIRANLIEQKKREGLK